MTVVNVFEKFTERSIKSVMIAQQEARALGAQEVTRGGASTAQHMRRRLAMLMPACHRFRTTPARSVRRLADLDDTVALTMPACPAAASPQVQTEHLLLGLVAEDTTSKNGYMNSGLTDEAVRITIEVLFGRLKPSTDENINFARDVRKTFELATNVSLLHNAGALRP